MPKPKPTPTQEEPARITRLVSDDAYWKSVIPTDPNKVIVGEGELLQKNRPIAKIRIDTNGLTSAQAFEKIRIEGAKIGADAVIQVKSYSQNVGSHVLNNGFSIPVVRNELEGLAVIFLEKQ